MFDYAQAAVEGALAAGAAYADARVVIATTESIDVQNRVVESVDRTETAGVGVRAMIGSSWGFYATADLTDTAARGAGAMAARIADASATVPGPDMVLADVPVVTDEYVTPHDEDPLAVPLAEKVDLLVEVTGTMEAVPGIAIARANLTCWVTDKWFVSSQGHRIKQRLVESGGGYDATAVGESETQRRSYPQSFGQFETGGYETVRRWDYAGNAARIAEEAAALLEAPAVEEGEKQLILEGSQLGL
ncbi:MAG: TldD/PmbA family protein, partial [Actinomycetota bacterium]|nr:TldD/PmbA family protein [Actinomycetota bacterium]